MRKLAESEKKYVVIAESLNLYDSVACERLATQAWAGRCLVVADSEPQDAVLALPESQQTRRGVPVVLCEDGYACWISMEDLAVLAPVKDAGECANVLTLSADEIAGKAVDVVKFVLTEGVVPNCYLWGGTAGPDYDCSGLVQRAFASVGVWIPRDAYQQEAFADPVSLDDVAAGDLVFFGKTKATHVGICIDLNSVWGHVMHCQFEKSNMGLEANTDHGSVKEKTLHESESVVDSRLVWYVHSSGEEYGNNGIGIDALSLQHGPVGAHYLTTLRGFGRIRRVCSV